MSNPRFSVLLVVKNARPLLAGTLASLESQTLKDFEVIVADGASTDGTLQMLHQATHDLPLRIVSEPDRSLSEGLAKVFRRTNGEIVGMLSADERYYPDTLAQVWKWFEVNPDAVMCGGGVDFIDEHDKVVGSHLTAPFNLQAHLACEIVPAVLSSFFNRPLIGDDFRYVADAPTCPDYEFWARLGFRFPQSAFKRYDVSIAQAYRTRDSMSFRAESFTQFCRDKLTHLNNLLAKGYAGSDHESLRQRASAGIHMWAAEQLNSIEPGHADILSHCAQAAQYDKSYGRIGRLVAALGNTRYDARSGIVHRGLSPRAAAIAQFEPGIPSLDWAGAAIVGNAPLIVQTSAAPWGYSLELLVSDAQRIGASLNGGQYWIGLDLEVTEGCVGVSLFSQHGLVGEQFFRPSDGRALARIPLAADFDPAISVMIRSGGQPSSIIRVYRAELLCDPDKDYGAVPALALPH